MKTIPVSNFTAKVDDADYPLVAGIRWCVLYRGKNTYAQSMSPRGLLMHRVIAGLKKGDPKKVDHRDCDGLNNQRYNLRVCTQSNNCANQRKHRKCSSQYKGVRLLNGRWSATVSKRIDGKLNRFHLGSFTNEQDAARAYDLKALELFGEFARLNFPVSAINLAA